MRVGRRLGALLEGGVRAVQEVAIATQRSASDMRPAQELGLLELLAEDFDVYQRKLWEPGFWAVAVHRLGTHGTHNDSAIASAVFDKAHRVLATGVDLLWGIDLPRSVQLGRRVRIWHSGCMRLHAHSIGNDVQIRHDTTLGPVRARDPEDGNLPVIEDRAELGSGVCVLGNVRVGQGAMIGANSLVLKDVPPKATVIGVPARILPT